MVFCWRANCEQADVALMFLTGRDNEVDKILGLEIGADDYITKPFNPRELTIRARNLLSRTMNLGTVSEERRSVDSYKFNGWELISTAVPGQPERRAVQAAAQ
jgi:two-component system aerobic respiration control protein ArcA